MDRLLGGRRDAADSLAFLDFALAEEGLELFARPLQLALENLRVQPMVIGAASGSGFGFGVLCPIIIEATLGETPARSGQVAAV